MADEQESLHDCILIHKRGDVKEVCFRKRVVKTQSADIPERP